MEPSAFNLSNLLSIRQSLIRLFPGEAAFQKPFEGHAVPRFVFAHFVNRVVDGVVTQFLGLDGNLLFTGTGAVFRGDPRFKIPAGIRPEDLSQEFGKTGGMLSLFEGNV